MSVKEIYGYGREYKNAIKNQEYELLNQEREILAKEMFENLGYGCYEDNYFITYKEYNDNSVKYEIVFVKDSRDIELNSKIYGKDHYFTRVNMKLLQAINKQVEELGWNK